MNGVARFLSRREKRAHDKSSSSKPRIVATHLYGVFSSEPNTKKSDKEEEKKIKTLTQRLSSVGVATLKEPQIEYALRSKYAEGDVDKAFDLLMLFEDSVEGILRDYNPTVKLLGAENRENVTCYLDALLFAMFARLDSFEAMLFDEFPEENRKKLAAILRFWVNMLRSGKLITTDITRHLQDALGTCGWSEATELRQQDASEAFTFITGKLELPLLTLKMDLYHAGKEDKEDDHKFVNERLLEVAIPGPTEQSGNTVTLEDCLETYFNNRIEVKRHLQRQNTLRSVRSMDTGKDHALHIETVELPSGAESPAPATPSSTTTPALPRRPIDGRRRTDSIFSERYIQEKGESSDQKILDEKTSPTVGRPRGASIRKEVMMPAWQFFSLIPWYTDNAPQNDAQVAAHFSVKRPVLGICLKRYSMLENGTPQRLDTFVDIPLEIALPHFVSDDRLEDEGPLFGNFKLSLQSVVCHRGVSVDSGHYISLVRGAAIDTDEVPLLEAGIRNSTDQWMLFDDLASERVSFVDIKEVLKKESPYLLFYRVEPIDEELARGAPPTYEEASSELPTVDPSMETISAVTSGETAETDRSTNNPSVTTLNTSITTINTSAERSMPGTTVSSPTPIERDAEQVDESVKLPLALADVTDFASRGPSLDIPRPDELQRGRSSMSSDHRRSLVIDDNSVIGSTVGSSTRGNTAPSTPAEERKGGFFSASRRGSKVGKQIGKSRSRPPSQSGEHRLSMTLNILASRMSKDKLVTSNDGTKTPGEDASPEDIDTERQKKDETPKISHSKSKKKKKDKRPKSMTGNVDLDLDQSKGKRPDRECTVM